MEVSEALDVCYWECCAKSMHFIYLSIRNGQVDVALKNGNDSRQLTKHGRKWLPAGNGWGRKSL